MPYWFLYAEQTAFRSAISSLSQSRAAAGVARPQFTQSQYGANIGGPIKAPSSYFMKSPPEQYTDEIAKRKLEDFIAGK